MKRAPDNAMKARLATLTGVPKAWPNQDFTLPVVPTDPAGRNAWAYLSCTILRAATTDDTIDAEAPLTTGRLIVTVVTLKGTGEARSDTLAEQVSSLFPMGLRMTAGGSITTIMSPAHIRDGVTDGSYWRVSVAIPFETTW